MYAIYKQHGIVSEFKCRTARRDDELRAEQADQQHAGVKGDLHQRIVEHEDFFRASESAHDLVGGLFEFLNFKVLSYKRFDNADAFHIFLHGFVQIVILRKTRRKIGITL